MELKNEAFYAYHKPYIDEGLIYEIYSDDDFSFMNIADQQYAVFTRKITENGNYLGFAMNKESLNFIIENGKDGYNNLLQYIGEKKLLQRAVYCNERTVSKLRDWKSKSINSKIIDKNFELELQQIMLSKGTTSNTLVEGFSK